MGKYHKTLTDDVFKDSVYITTLEKALNCNNFKKEHKEEYNAMLDIFQTFIRVNNILFADSDRTINDKVNDLQIELEKCLFGNRDNDSKYHKYSVRFINALPDKETRFLYNSFINWYEYLCSIEKLGTIPNEVEEEMIKLEKCKFDNVVRNGIDFEKNKDSKYKIYVSKFNTLNDDRESFSETYKKDFKDMYGKDLTDEEFSNIAFIYDLIAKANNGIVNVISLTPVKEYNLDEKTTPIELYKAYLDSLHIYNKKIDRMDALHFMLMFTMNYQENIMPRGISVNDAINNYNGFVFLTTMESKDIEKEFKVNNDLIKKIMKDLKEIHKIMTQKATSTEEVIENHKVAFKEITKLIERHIDYFIRVS